MRLSEKSSFQDFRNNSLKPIGRWVSVYLNQYFRAFDFWHFSDSLGESTQDNASPVRAQKLSEKGIQDTRQVARKLAEVLPELPPDYKISIGEIWHGSETPVCETVNIFRDILSQRKLVNSDQTKYVRYLNPTHFGSYENKGIQDKIVKCLEDHFIVLSKKKIRENAIMVIGHQPLLGWIAYHLTKKSIPISRSELICLASRNSAWHNLLGINSWHLLWSISEEDNKTMEELRAKIKSKMYVAELLGALIVPVLGLILGFLLDPEKFSKLNEQSTSKGAIFISAGLFFISIGLYMATMYEYDRLLMPTRFWGEKPLPKKIKKRPKWLVWRPPSSAAWVLYQNMIRIWNYMFIPATFAVIGGLISLAYAVFRPSWIFMVLASMVIILFGFYYQHFRAKIGTED